MTEREEDWAKDLWPEDDDYWPEYDPVATQQLLMGTTPRHEMPPRRRRLLGLMTTAAVAVAAGIGGALAAKDLTAGSATPAQAHSGQPGGSQSNGSLPNTGQGGTGEGGQLPQGVAGAMVIGGRVTAVSPRSITITAGPQAVTARVTGSTRFSGDVTGIAGVRVGDMVMAQISESNGVNSLVALQDPVSVS
jgi:hypothetical protein